VDHSNQTPAQRFLSEPENRRSAVILGVCFVVLLGLTLAGTLTPVPALVVFVAVTIGVVVAPVLAGDLRNDDDTPPVANPTGRPADSQIVTRLIESFPDPAIATDHIGRVMAFNAAARELAPALRIDDLVSMSLRAPEVVDAMRRVRAGDEPVRVEFTQRAPEQRWHEVIVVPARLSDDPASDLARITLIIFHDLTPLHRVEEMRADFVANASHELRTPLAALSGFIETLQGPARNDDAARARFLPIMHAQATRMARLIDDLLSLSRIELKAHQRPSARVDLASLIRQVVDGLQVLADERGVIIAIDIRDNDLTVLGDRDDLLRAFENLIENALKYGAAGKRVDVIAEPDAGDGTTPGIAIHVRDYGPGIPPEHLPRLTERFYRVDVRGSRDSGGTGLGLALVKHIINRHRGRLRIESEAGQGATFTAILPRPPAAPLQSEITQII
jgi:two-component system phosphate regulon sensor histidine kinase PhoR